MVPVLLSLQIKIISTMAKRTFSQTQLGFIAILWVILAGYVLMNAEINGITIISLIMSAIIVFVPIYKNLRK
ncbi:hypothetical protein ING2E5A_0282 [Petrimonas mucosa]|jgi:hypothetical protein|uniref:Uncharacterized protein n=1 Tax=Petrimonas mucosa TaxID=1642646 RepID=A0A1G4G3R4_9BACT|nr:hypothetical protein ING2E5A_0282 [Petrimonas mucosa]SFU46247.1 hypothetical protein SAMN05216364_101445 [Porphyromonadaceae bacterium KHP3R9]